MNKYYNKSELDPKYKVYDPPIPKIEGIPILDRDYRYWLNSKLIDKFHSHVKLDKSFENQYDNIPLFVEQYEFADNINSILKNIILNSNLDITKRSTNVKAGMTEYDFGKKHIEFKPLLKWIKSKLRKYTPLVYHMDERVKNNKYTLMIEDCWGSVYNKGDFTQPHHHMFTDISIHWSWIYYIDITDKCSPLVFTISNKKIQPDNGNLIIFPSYLVHHVPIQKNNYSRIVVAGNHSIMSKPKI